MDSYVSRSFIEETVEFFKGRQYNKPEQIGLFFYFKAAGINKLSYTTYKKWGEMADSDKRKYMRILYDLSGIFDASREVGLKRTALFPFSINNDYKNKNFYNGGSVFSQLGSRIKDTLDNALVSTLIQRNSRASDEIKLRNDSIQSLYESYLKRQKTPIELFSAWYYRFWRIQIPESSNDQDFSDICVLSFLSDFGITEEEYRSFFTFGTHTVNMSATKISGSELREILNINEDCAPEINDEGPGDFMIQSMTLPEERVKELLDLRGPTLTEERIIEVLSQWDTERLVQAEQENAADQTTETTIATENPIRFSTGIASTFERNRIVFGAPGTGKSYRLRTDCDALIDGTTGTYERVTFHPEYSYSQFVGCYKPITNDDGEIRYDFVPGPFMRVYVSALKSGRTDFPQPHLLLIEEINRAKVASVFGEVFQLLDRDDSNVSEYEIHTSEDVRKHLTRELGGIPEDYACIRIPDNMFIWASMNSADQGVFPMDTAFKRRWNFEYLGINENDSSVGGKIVLGTDAHALEVDWNQLRKAINEKLATEYRINEDKLIGPFFLGKKVFAFGESGEIVNPQRFKDAFKSKVLMYLYEDAAKQYKNRLFTGCDNSKYSSVCAAFDEIGIDIFGDDFRGLYDRMGV